MRDPTSYKSVVMKLMQYKVTDVKQWLKDHSSDIANKSEEEINDYIDDYFNDPKESASATLRKKKKIVKREEMHKCTDLNGRVCLVIEDTRSGKDFWNSILDRGKVVVKSLADVDTRFSGNDSFPNCLRSLDTTGDTFIFLPDAVDIYPNSMTVSLWSRIQKYAKGKGTLVYGYIGFEWLFVQSVHCSDTVLASKSAHSNLYTKLHDICKNSLSEQEYRDVLQSISIPKSKHKLHTLENCCSDVMNILASPVSVTKSIIGTKYTVDDYKKIACEAQCLDDITGRYLC